MATSVKTPAVPQAEELSAAQIRGAIAEAERQLKVAEAEENMARLKFTQGQARSVAGLAVDLPDLEAVLAATSSAHETLKERREQLDALLPVAEFRELLAERDRRVAHARKAEERLLELAPIELDLEQRLDALRAELARTKIEAASGAVSREMGLRIAEFVARHRDALIAAGIDVEGEG